jgi:hypothetical protein
VSACRIVETTVWNILQRAASQRRDTDAAISVSSNSTAGRVSLPAGGDRRGGADAIVGGQVGSEVIVAAAQVLHERVPAATTGSERVGFGPRTAAAWLSAGRDRLRLS